MDKKFSKYVYGDSCTYKHAKGTSAYPAREFHAYHEILLFVGGSTTFHSDEKRIPLSENQIIIIPKETYHQFVNVVDAEYHRCVFSFYDIPEFSGLIEKCMHSVRVIDASDGQKRLFEKMNEIVDSDFPEEEKQILMHSLLALTLSEVSREKSSVNTGSKPSEITAKAIEIINAGIYSKILIPELSKMLNVSVSTLTQTFRKDMNISLYRYVIRKKLTLAQQKIQEGESATVAAFKLGFNDYSSFYKQYKKMFGVAPSENAERFDRLQ